MNDFAAARGAMLMDNRFAGRSTRWLTPPVRDFGFVSAGFRITHYRTLLLARTFVRIWPTLTDQWMPKLEQ